MLMASATANVVGRGGHARSHVHLDCMDLTVNSTVRVRTEEHAIDTMERAGRSFG